MAIIFRRTTRGGKPAKNYSIKFKGETGKWITVAGLASKELTKQKAHDLEERVLNVKAGRVDPFDASKAAPLKEHVKAYQRYLEGKGRSPDHVGPAMTRIHRVLQGCGFTNIDHLTSYDASDKITAYLSKQHGDGLTASTVNRYLSHLKSFIKWAVRQNRMPLSPISLMGTIDDTGDDDERRERRAISGDDFAKLIKTAALGVKVQRQTAEDRAWLYMTAAYTGLRASELASLTPGSFKLDGGAPCVLVRAGYTKNGQEARQPIRPDFAAMLAGWLAGKSGKLWPGKWYRRAAEMLRVDLEAAGVPYVDDEGRVFDFHSLRVTFITNLARAGVHPKIAQKLARHGSIDLTMNVYTRLSDAEISEGLRGLPAPVAIG
jgi:integrase